MSLKLMLKNFFMTDIRYNGWGFPEDGTAARIKKLEAKVSKLQRKLTDQAIAGAEWDRVREEEYYEGNMGTNAIEKAQRKDQ